MTIAKGELEGAELELIADLLMAAAYADGQLDGIEVKTVLSIVVELLDGGDVPAALIERLNAFDPASFELEAACAGLGLTEREQKRALLGLLARISEADEIHDLDEGAFICQVAEQIDADEAIIEGLAGAVSVAPSPKPPPVPGS